MENKLSNPYRKRTDKQLYAFIDYTKQRFPLLKGLNIIITRDVRDSHNGVTNTWLGTFSRSRSTNPRIFLAPDDKLKKSNLDPLVVLAHELIHLICYLFIYHDYPKADSYEIITDDFAELLFESYKKKLR